MSKRLRRIYVFGTTINGDHAAAGKSKQVVDLYNAKHGVSEGITGNAYAIPVYDENGKILPLEKLRGPTQRFIKFANQNPQFVFELSRVGCGGLAYDDFDMAPFFTDAPDNVQRPAGWRTHYLDMRNRV